MACFQSGPHASRDERGTPTGYLADWLGLCGVPQGRIFVPLLFLVAIWSIGQDVLQFKVDDRTN